MSVSNLIQNKETFGTSNRSIIQNDATAGDTGVIGRDDAK